MRLLLSLKQWITLDVKAVEVNSSGAMFYSLERPFRNNLIEPQTEVLTITHAEVE